MPDRAFARRRLELEIVVADVAAEHVALVDRVAGRWRRLRDRLSKIKGSVRPRLVVVAEVLADGRLEVTSRADEQVVEALCADGPHEPFGKRVRSRRSDRDLDGLDAD